MGLQGEIRVSRRVKESHGYMPRCLRIAVAVAFIESLREQAPYPLPIIKHMEKHPSARVHAHFENIHQTKLMMLIHCGRIGSYTPTLEGMDKIGKEFRQSLLSLDGMKVFRLTKTVSKSILRDEAVSERAMFLLPCLAGEFSYVAILGLVEGFRECVENQCWDAAVSYFILRIMEVMLLARMDHVFHDVQLHQLQISLSKLQESLPDEVANKLVREYIDHLFYIIGNLANVTFQSSPDLMVVPPADFQIK